MLGLVDSGPASAFEILTLGTSATNCKGVDRDKIYPVKLQEILRGDGIDAMVINGGVDGDRVEWMFQRLPAALTSNTKLVLFQGGSVGRDKAYEVEYIEKTLAFLRDRHIAVIYMSDPKFQTKKEAAATAAKYGAYYFGHFAAVVPNESKYWLGDTAQFGGSGSGWGGHMNAEGCALVARSVAPLVEKALAEKAGITANRR
jgi:acyl-CoA thioesterase-1